MSGSSMTRARAVLTLTSCAAVASTRAPVLSQPSPIVRVAVLPIEGAAEVFFANDMGFFAAAKLNVETENILVASAMAAAMVSNSLDIGYSPLDALALLHTRQIPVTVIAPANEYLSPSTERIAGLVIAPESTVSQAKDFNGKIIAVNSLRSLSETGPRAWIDHNGGDSSTVKFVEIPFLAMPAALDANRTDAAWMVEPFLSIAAQRNRVLAYGFDAISKRFLVAAWFTTTQWATAHRDALTRFQTVMRQAASWANANPDRSGAILAKYAKIDPAVLNTMARARYGEDLSSSTMQPLINASAKYYGFKAFPAQELIYSQPR